MYIIIAGCGKVGANLAKKLSDFGHDVAVIDRDEKSFEQLGTGYNFLTITGIPIDEDVLKDAGIESADALAAVTNDDNTNIMISQIARQLYRVPKVITRSYDPESTEVLDNLGLDAICTTVLAVDCFFDRLTREGDGK